MLTMLQRVCLTFTEPSSVLWRTDTIASIRVLCSLVPRPPGLISVGAELINPGRPGNKARSCVAPFSQTFVTHCH